MARSTFTLCSSLNNSGFYEYANMLFTSMSMLTKANQSANVNSVNYVRVCTSQLSQTFPKNSTLALRWSFLDGLHHLHITTFG